MECRTEDRFFCPWDPPGENTGMGCHALLQGIFLTQELNLSLLHLLQADSLPTEPPGKPQMRWLNGNLFSHSSLEGRRLRSRCQQGHAFSEAAREESFLAASSFQGVAGNTWLVDGSLQSLFPSAYAILPSVCLSVFM